MSVALWASVPLLALVAIEDLRHRRIRNRHVLLLYAVAAIAAAVRAIDGDGGVALRAAIGMTVAAFPLVVAAVAQPTGLGGGDVKLAAAIGALLGVISPWLSLAVVAGALALTLGALAVRRVPHAPLAPALAASAATALLLSAAS